MHSGECSTVGVAELERFWSKVDKSGECWLWTRSKCSDGYGTVYFRGRVESSHRASYLLSNGPIPDGLRVLHRCDVRACVRPDHLFLGTQRENVLDMHQKGRTNYQRGERHYATKLSWDDVREIRRRAAEGETQLKMAREFGLQPAAINKIVRRRTWRSA